MYLPSGDQSLGDCHWSSWYSRRFSPLPSAARTARRALLVFAGITMYTIFLPSGDHAGVVPAASVLRRVRRPLAVSKTETSGFGPPYFTSATLCPSGEMRGSLLPRSPRVPRTFPLTSNQVSWPSSAEFTPLA